MRMPQAKVKWIEYLLEKYGEDYEVQLNTLTSLSSLPSNVSCFIY